MALLSRYLPAVAVAGFLVYTAYEAVQQEEVVETAVDYVEFLLGLSLGLILPT